MSASKSIPNVDILAWNARWRSRAEKPSVSWWCRAEWDYTMPDCEEWVEFRVGTRHKKRAMAHAIWMASENSEYIAPPPDRLTFTKVKVVYGRPAFR